MIHKRGYWLSKRETRTHEFDAKLCTAILAIFHEKTVIDIGCGDGSYVKQIMLSDPFLYCIGYDGSPLTPEISHGLCYIKDFSRPQTVGKFDLVLSLEVGEHIPEKYESVFIDNICNAANKYICVSWAIEGQPGVGHVNCRDNDYIIAKFFERGFMYDELKTLFLRNNSTLPWFKNTLFTFIKTENDS